MALVFKSECVLYTRDDDDDDDSMVLLASLLSNGQISPTLTLHVESYPFAHRFGLIFG